ncbi:MAG: ThuA domain-containing protein [Armatimonadia bacterium]
MTRVLVWNENRHEKQSPHIAALYPDGIHGALASHLRTVPGLDVRSATQDEPECGLSADRLSQTDVLVYWGHIAQNEIPDEIVDRLQRHILAGLGLVILHSACISKIATRLLGTTGMMKWRESGEHQRHWVVAPGHPIAEGVPEHFEIAQDETYGEHFDIPAPDELIFIGWSPGGEVLRSGTCYTRGLGRIFLFTPGHETYPVYHDQNVLKVIANAAKWAAKAEDREVVRGNVQPLEPLARP